MWLQYKLFTLASSEENFTFRDLCSGHSQHYEASARKLRFGINFIDMEHHYYFFAVYLSSLAHPLSLSFFRYLFFTLVLSRCTLLNCVRIRHSDGT